MLVRLSHAAAVPCFSNGKMKARPSGLSLIHSMRLIRQKKYFAKNWKASGIALVVAMLSFCSGNAAGPSVVQGVVSEARIAFNIRAQPLADALTAYSEITGLEVYYDGTLAVGRRSTAVVGTLKPLDGLKVLLRGTGYAPRATGSDTLTLETARPLTSSAHVSMALIRRYEPYFAALQTTIARRLCELDIGGSNELILSFVISETGVIVSAESLTPGGNVARDAAIAADVRGLRIDPPPPPELPQPITMAIYPLSASDTSGCATGISPRENNRHG